MKNHYSHSTTVVQLAASKPTLLLFTKTCAVFVCQYADPVTDLLDKWGVFRARLFRESCVFHRGNYVKVSPVPIGCILLSPIGCVNLAVFAWLLLAVLSQFLLAMLILLCYIGSYWLC